MSPALAPLLQLIVALPLLALLCARCELRVRSALAAAGFFVIMGLAWRAPWLLDWHALQVGDWNWTGKLLSVGISCVVVVGLRRAGRADFVHWPQRGTLRPAIVAAVLLLVPAVAAGVLSGRATFDAETLAFQATVPGLDEELAFRGVLLALLLPPGSAARPARWIAIATVAALFGAVHGVRISGQGALILEPGYWAWTGAAGCVWGWMTLRTGSIVPAMVSHNAANVTGYLLTLA